MIPRRLHRWWANLAGFFWTPCPLCGREFGGHQWIGAGTRRALGHAVSIPIPNRAPGDRSGTAICPRCVRAGEGCAAWARVQRTTAPWAHDCPRSRQASGGTDD